MKRIAVFLDHANITIAARDRGKKVDFSSLLEYLADEREGRTLVEAFSYVALDPRNEHARDPEIEDLWNSGWVVHTKLGTRTGEVGYKCNVDVEMAMDMISFAYEVKPDVVVLLSGDIDFIPVVLKLRERGIRVEVGALRSCVSRKLRMVCSGFIDLEQSHIEEERDSTAPPTMEDMMADYFQNQIALENQQDYNDEEGGTPVDRRTSGVNIPSSSQYLDEV